MTITREAAAPGGEAGGGTESKAGGLHSIFPQARPATEVAIDLVSCTPAERAAFMAGYESGWAHAASREHADYTQAMEDLARHYVRMVHLDEELERTISTTVARGPFDAAADRRGQHQRAAAARRLLRERGVA